MNLLARIRGFLSTRPPRHRRHCSAAPLTTLPALRDPPPEIVAALREVDATAELAYLGLGVWVLGSVQPNSFRRQQAEKLIENERELPVERQRMGRFRLARLKREGLRPIDFVDESAVQSGKIVRDFRFADWRYRHCADEAFEENLRGSDEETEFQERLKLLLDYTAHELPSVWAHAFRGRRHFLQRTA